MKEDETMYREERKIYFSTPELFKALALFCETTNLRFPFNDDAKIDFRTESELVATLSDPDQSDVTREFLESEVIVALILLCKKMDIPVARKAVKTIELSEEKIVFAMKLSDESATIHDLSS